MIRFAGPNSRAHVARNTLKTAGALVLRVCRRQAFHTRPPTVGFPRSQLPRLQYAKPPFSISPLRPELSSSLCRQIHVISQGRRGFSFWPSKMFFKIIRVPAAAGGAVAGALAYVNYKVQSVANYTHDKLEKVGDWIGDSYSTVKDKLDNIEIPSIDFELPAFAEWWKEVTHAAERKESSSSEEGSDSSSASGNEAGGGVVGTVAAAFGLVNQESDSEKATDDQMMVLTKKMIEIRGILQKINIAEALQLPSIVVIGSQSSGKSSVLEAIVGHEFLPKGNNMVTRRPIELTLINTPESASEYGEFPALGGGKITDFSTIQKTLLDLNLSVPDSQGVSDDPIQLTIYSPHVPDLTMIDLPGYIQIAASDQPDSLKNKISALCDKYIQPPNIILAISAADVDLANSAALRACRRVDPRGERTIGVITKMDLVNPSRAVDILKNRNYPLQMGYVGVSCKLPSGHSLFRRPSDITTLISKHEAEYFGQHPEFEEHECTVGSGNLRKKLMYVLEQTMSRCLQPTANSVHHELEEATYQFKVEFNDRVLTPETYLAESVDSFKLAFKDFSSRFGRNQVRLLLKSELDQQVLDLLAQRYWNKPYEMTKSSTNSSLEPSISILPSASRDDLVWHRKLDSATSSLTKLGIGRLTTTLVIDALTDEMDRLVNNGPFKNHPFARDIIRQATDEILNARYLSTSDQVENCIKPYKYEIEVDDRDWASSRDHSYALLKEELSQCNQAYDSIKKSVGAKKLSSVVKYVEHSRSNKPLSTVENSEAFGFSRLLLDRGSEALFLRNRADILKLRMMAIKSSQCKIPGNKYYCPEIFLDAVANKLTSTAVLFLNVELLSDFYYNFPRELDEKLSKSLTRDQIEHFAKEDPKIKRQIELQQRKAMLDLALGKIEEVMALQNSIAVSSPSSGVTSTNYSRSRF